MTSAGVAAGVAAGVLASAQFSKAAPAKKPNFVWIISEDNSKHYLKMFFPSGAPAPNIEALAEEGVTFTNAFSNGAVCSVARSTLITGILAPRLCSQYHRRQGMANLPAGVHMFPWYLRQDGYYTTNKSKKDYNVIEGQGVWDASSNKASWRNRPSKDTPFFHKTSSGVSHEGRLHFKADKMTPENIKTDPAKIELAPYHPDTPTFRHTYAVYHDCMKAVDDLVGGIIGELKEDGLLEDTFVFYFGDHGGVLPRGKGYIQESGVNVPLVVRIPKNFQHLVDVKPGTRTDGFVSFIDFGPTLLQLAGIKIPEVVDGVPFIGPGVSKANLEARDETYSYADRFDEKYDLVRALRKGRYKYMRNYQGFYPDGLHNNYRYKMIAYREWRDLYNDGKLNAAQSQFYEPRPAEQLFDIETDSHEVKDLSSDPKYAKTLADMRARFQKQVKALPDLSFYPEPYLLENALDDGIAFGLKHKAEIARLADIADLSLLPFKKAKPGIEKAIASGNRFDRYWAMIVCSCFGDNARPLTAKAKALLNDSDPLVRIRAAEFLAIIGAVDPRPTFYDVLNTTDSAPVAQLALNTVVFVNDHLDGYEIDVKKLKLKVKGGGVARRMEYLNALAG